MGSVDGVEPVLAPQGPNGVSVIPIMSGQQAGQQVDAYVPARRECTINNIGEAMPSV
jgi:hypothetical protein